MRITNPYFGGFKYMHFFCVCDGHGHYGDKVSGFLSLKLPLYLETHIKFVLNNYTEMIKKNAKNVPLET